jgi:hypothetical protein
LAAIAHKPFGSQMLEMQNVSWVAPRESLPANAMVLTDISHGRPTHARDSQLRSSQGRPSEDRSPITMLIGKDTPGDCPVMPYPMHPGIVNYAGRAQREACRRIENRRGIFFSGSQRAKYGRDVLRKGFDVLNRLEILDLVRASFSDRVVLSRDEGQHPMPIVLPAAEGAKANAPIPIERWLATLASHQFFLCCPGIAQPMCHNIIEAMSVGVIPIIEYPERFSPPLIDGETAICYRGQDGLADAVARVDRMSAGKILQMSENVAAHYDQHLDGAKFLGGLLAQSAESTPASISLPFHDENLTAMKMSVQANLQAKNASYSRAA